MSEPTNATNSPQTDRTATIEDRLRAAVAQAVNDRLKAAKAVKR